MNEIIEGVWSLAREFMKNPKYVSFDKDKIEALGEKIKEYAKENSQCSSLKLPKCISSGPPGQIERIFWYELLVSSVNFCYWYGRSTIRPEGSSSAKMYALLDEAFEVKNREAENRTFSSQQYREEVAKLFQNKLMMSRFPLVDQRVRCIDELIKKDDELGIAQIGLKELVCIPEFSRDLFLKRAFLFIMQLYRRGCVLPEEVQDLPIPADYQIPKMLRYLGCIYYSDELSRKVDSGELIPEGSLMECEIRAVSIIACKLIADRAGCTCEVVDRYLWSKRKECSDPFHLTITTNY